MSKPLGPYTPAVRAGDFIFVSGQVGVADGSLAAGGVAGQTAQAVANLTARLAELGAELTDVVKTTCFLVDMDSVRHVQHRLRRGVWRSPARPLDRCRA